MTARRPPSRDARAARSGGASPAGDAIRRFFLYGYEERALEDRFMHCERIEEQLQRYDWDAKPHIHDGLHQIQFFEKGSGQLLVESDWQDFQAPVLLFVPSGTVHGFHFSRDTEGFVLTLSQDFLEEVLGIVDGEVRRVVDAPRVNLLSQAEAREHAIGAVMRLIEDDYLRGTTGRTTALVSAMALMLVKLARLQSRRRSVRTAGPHEELYQRFRDLVEQDFRTQPPVSQMARKLNVSEGRLTASCRAVAGLSPQQLLHARVLMEARRQLLYTVRPSSSIAYALGFKDPAYFSRFFKRATGKTPREYRRPSRDNPA